MKRIRAILVPLISVAFFILALLVLHRELHDFHFLQILRHMQRIPFWRIGLSLVLTGMSYLALTAIEALLFVHVEHPLPYAHTALASFISTSVSHNVGYALFSAGTLRFRFYSAWGVPIAAISTVIGAHAVFFWMGFVLLAGALFLAFPFPLPPSLHLPVATLPTLSLVLLALLAVFLAVVLSRFRIRVRSYILRAPAPWLSFVLLGLSACDWFFAGSALFVLLPAGLSAPLPVFLGIYLLAQVVGNGSQVPGGLGVFESVFLTLLSAGSRSGAAAGALILYRGIYYIVPLIASTVLLAVQSAVSAAGKARRLSQAVTAWLSRIFGGWLPAILPTLFSITTLVGGAILLFSGSTPAIGSRMRWIGTYIPLPLIEASHFLASLAGTALIFLAVGLKRRLDAAYRLTLVMLLAGILFSLAKGFDYEEAILLAVMLLLLLPNRRLFYRRSSFFNEPLGGSWAVALLIIFICSLWLVIFSSKHIEYSRELWWQFELTAHTPRSMRALVGALILAAILAFRRLLRPLSPPPNLPLEPDLERIKPIIARSAETYAYLALLGDKSLLLSESGSTFLMYAVRGRSWVALGDPVGEEQEAAELAWKFREMVDRHNGWPVFYEVGSRNIPLYIDLGLTFFKFGEEARVDLAAFGLEGGHSKWMRHVVNRIEREGHRFDILPAGEAGAHIAELRLVSDDWLRSKNTREKGFSLGFFHEPYLRHFPVAVLRKDGRITAFANVWLGAAGSELSVDLMRYSADAPEGAMDFLFIQLMLWGKAQRFGWFNLGMSPMSGFIPHNLTRSWSKLGFFLFRRGEHFYHFQGLRQYKEKFHPVWTPRYLAMLGSLTLPRVLTNLGELVSGSLKGVVSK